MSRRLYLFFLACFWVGLLGGFRAELELSGDPAARHFFQTNFLNRRRLAYRWTPA
ncbi:MAG TPA: hypothetical protein GXX33_04185, partial [Firmicutes bacterium]|nr:hypothetical protein [Bacillota bacterium]